MNRFLFGIATIALGAAPVSCNPFTLVQPSVVLDVTKLDAPATISAGSVLTVVLTVTTGGCRSFDHITMERQSSGATLTAWGFDSARGDPNVPCPANIASEPHSVEIPPPFQSSFTVQVSRGRLSPLTATVQVQ
jgi:hypothetical protein